MRTLPLIVLPLLAAPAFAQTPSPSPRTAPRAAWSLVPATTGTPAQRRDTPGTASADRFYVFAGRDGNAGAQSHNALYEFDGTTWTLKTPNTAAPGFPTARGGCCVAWNFTTNKLVVFGGETGSGLVGGPTIPNTFLGDTWEWDPNTNTWTDMTPISPAPTPSARRQAAMAWDPATGGMLLFGGSPVAGTYTNETWLWVGGSWVQINPATVPPVRGQHSLVTRPDFGDVLMCSGVKVNPPAVGANATDVWRWNGADWSLVPTVGHPHSCIANQAVYDPLRKRVVIQGGNGLRVGDTTWSTLWDGSPSGWCSELDCLTNEWKLYGGATHSVTDPVIGRISRYPAAFVPALGKVVKALGQPNGGTLNAVQYQATPVAATSPYGTGCTGPGGALTLVADDRPWTERTWQCTATGLGPLSFGFAMVSLGQLSPGVPLPVLPIPGGGLGCELLVASLDITAGLVPSGGAAAFTLTLPSAQVDPTLPGLAFYVQVAELDFSAGWVGTYATNALACTIGAL